MPFPSQAQSSKLSLLWLYYQYKPPQPPPVIFEPGAFKPGQGLPSLTRGFQGRPGASKPEAPRDFKFEMPIPGPWPWPCPKPLKLYSKLKPGNGTALSDFKFILLLTFVSWYLSTTVTMSMYVHLHACSEDVVKPST